MQYAALGNLKKLLTLDLYGSSIQDGDLIHLLKNLPDLQHINIGWVLAW